MPNLPKVTITYSNGNLGSDIQADGVGAIIGTAAQVGLQGLAKQVYDLDDAIAKGYTEADEPEMFFHLKELFGQLGGRQKVNVMGVPDTMTLAQMLDNTNANGAKKLISAAGQDVALLAAFRKPGGGYSGGANLIDTDVATAITNSKVFGQARLAELRPLRMLIEGRVQNTAAANTLTPNSSTNGFAGVVLGGTRNGGQGSVGLALGRALAYGAHVKVGRVLSGPLTANEIYIGARLLKDVTELDTLHGAGFMSFTTHPQKAGFYFGIDRMCSTDDFKLLARGRVIDKAARICASVYVDQIEDTVELEANGNIASHVITYLEEQIRQTVLTIMTGQISNILVYIDPAQTITTNDTLKITKIRVQPLGYKSFIEVDLGFSAAV